MGRPRGLHATASAIAQRPEIRLAKEEPGDFKIVEGQIVDDAPPIHSESSLEEAIRMKAIYDARKSRAAAETEALRLMIDRSKLMTRESVLARESKRNAIMLDALPKLVDASVKLFPLADQVEARRNLMVILADFRRKMAEALASA